jgi:hypothetical protein
MQQYTLIYLTPTCHSQAGHQVLGGRQQPAGAAVQHVASGACSSSCPLLLLARPRGPGAEAAASGQAVHHVRPAQRRAHAPAGLPVGPPAAGRRGRGAAVRGPSERACGGAPWAEGEAGGAAAKGHEVRWGRGKLCVPLLCVCCLCVTLLAWVACCYCRHGDLPAPASSCPLPCCVRPGESTQSLLLRPALA